MGITSRQIVAVAAASLLVTAVLIYLQRPGTPVVTPVSEITYETGITPNGNPYRGSSEAPVRIDLYSDFTCPHCRDFAAVLKALTKDYIKPGDLQVVFHNFPYLSPQSNEAARAAVSACDQGADKFWQYHDLLFAGRSHGERVFTEEWYISLARELDLDVVRFTNQMKSNESDARVQKEFDEGRNIGVRKIPTWFVNGRKGIGTPPEADLRKIIDSFLDK